MNCKSTTRMHKLALALAAGILTTTQAGCQIPATSMFSTVYRPIPLDNSFLASETKPNSPVLEHFEDVQAPEGSQLHVRFSDVANNSLVEPGNRHAFESEQVGYKFAYAATEPVVVTRDKVAQVDWEAPIESRNQPTTIVGDPLWKTANTETGRVIAQQAMRNLDARSDKQPQSMGWENSFAKARKLEHQDELQGAAAIYESLVEHGFKQPEVFHRLAVCYDQTDRAQLSLPLYEQALELDPNNPEILCDLAYRLQLVGNVKAAERFYNLALRYDPEHSRANNHLGVLLAQDNRKDEAYKYFRAGGLNMWQAKRNVTASLHNQKLGKVFHQ